MTQSVVPSYSGIYLSAAHKSSGKTIVSIGICAAVYDSCQRVQSFKKGPDYIDPLWLAKASMTNCYNLDFNTQSHSHILNLFQEQSSDCGFAIVEGNKGLHDGVSVDGCDSNAALVKLLSLPVILVLDTQGTTRGIAPLLLGYQQFDPQVEIAGVILNKVAGPRHEQKLIANIQAHTDFKVMGAIPRHSDLLIDQRHLGLRPSNEMDRAEDVIQGIQNIIKDNVDLQAILQIKSSAGFVGVEHKRHSQIKSNSVIKIGVARDSAFGFYYSDDLIKFAECGAEIVFFDTLNDTHLPGDVDGLLIGGGFPEVMMQSLGKNQSMKDSILHFINANGPVYAECGGLMYLGGSISWDGHQSNMVNALPIRSIMEKTPVGRGYVRLKETGRSKWGKINVKDGAINAHEFHYSRIEMTGDVEGFAYEVERGWGLDGKVDGMIYKNVLASYSHLRSIDPVNWVSVFVEFVKSCKIRAKNQYETSEFISYVGNHD